MGKKGDKRTSKAKDAAAEVVARLGPVGDVSSRGMFGGYGIFESGVMFALVNSSGDLFLRADDITKERFEQAGAARHGRMPYYSVPDAVWEDGATLRAWASDAAAVAHAAKRG